MTSQNFWDFKLPPQYYHPQCGCHECEYPPELSPSISSSIIIIIIIIIISRGLHHALQGIKFVVFDAFGLLDILAVGPAALHVAAARIGCGRAVGEDVRRQVGGLLLGHPNFVGETSIIIAIFTILSNDSKRVQHLAGRSVRHLRLDALSSPLIQLGPGALEINSIDIFGASLSLSLT